MYDKACRSARTYQQVQSVSSVNLEEPPQNRLRKWICCFTLRFLTQLTVETDCSETMKKSQNSLFLEAGVLTAILQIILGSPACHQEDPSAGQTRIVRLDAAVDRIIPPTAKIEKLAEGFKFTEGPVWHNDGYLLFSDLGSDQIYKWMPNGQVSAWQPTSRYTGVDGPEYSFFRSNGLTLDREGRLTICGHGNRRVMRLEKTGFLTVLADRYEGKRLNSPNDLVYRSDGTLYFTDPPFGLPKSFDNPRRELPYSGIFSLQNGKLRLISTNLSGPNGLAFSPDEKYLYVTNSDAKKPVVMRYEANADGALSNGQVFFDMRNASGKKDDLDGMKVDQRGNLYVTGPGGLWIISPEGKHLGTIKVPELPANVAWGDDDGKTLYMTAETGLYRIRLNIPGIRP